MTRATVLQQCAGWHAYSSTPQKKNIETCWLCGAMLMARDMVVRPLTEARISLRNCGAANIGIRRNRSLWKLQSRSTKPAKARCTALGIRNSALVPFSVFSSCRLLDSAQRLTRRMCERFGGELPSLTGWTTRCDFLYVTCLYGDLTCAGS